MEVFGKKNRSIITLLSIICLVTISMQCFGWEAGETLKNLS